MSDRRHSYLVLSYEADLNLKSFLQENHFLTVIDLNQKD